MPKPKQPSVAERINALAQGKPVASSSSKTLVVVEKPKIEKIEKTDRRKLVNGGKRPGSGRKATGPTNVTVLQVDKRKRMHELLSEFADQEVEVNLRDVITGEKKLVKMTRYMLSLHQQFKLIEKGDASAINSFHDRLLGSPAQPVVGDDDSPPIQVEIGPLLKKIYGD